MANVIVRHSLVNGHRIVCHQTSWRHKTVKSNQTAGVQIVFYWISRTVSIYLNLCDILLHNFAQIQIHKC